MATKTVKLTEFNATDREMRYVDFARFVQNQGIEAYEVAELCRLAQRAFKAGERYCNSGSDRDARNNERTGERFEIKAKSLGFEVSWPGLWPRLAKDGQDVYLPTMD